LQIYSQIFKLSVNSISLKINIFVLLNSLTTLGVGVFGECKSLEAVTLSENIEVMESNLFGLCTSLKTLTVPAKVKTISVATFYDCIELHSIHLKGSTPPEVIGDKHFRTLDMNTCKLYIPKGSLSLYSKADVWKDFANIVEE